MSGSSPQISIDNDSLIVNGNNQLAVNNLTSGSATPAGSAIAIPMSTIASANIGPYSVASLPTPTPFAPGTGAFASNGRNSGETTGAGTGCPVFLKNTILGVKTWCAVWSGIAVTS